jgi:hypothetical protein
MTTANQAPMPDTTLTSVEADLFALNLTGTVQGIKAEWFRLGEAAGRQKALADAAAATSAAITTLLDAARFCPCGAAWNAESWAHYSHNGDRLRFSDKRPTHFAPGHPMTWVGSVHEASPTITPAHAHDGDTVEVY